MRSKHVAIKLIYKYIHSMYQNTEINYIWEFSQGRNRTLICKNGSIYGDLKGRTDLGDDLGLHKLRTKRFTQCSDLPF